MACPTCQRCKVHIEELCDGLEVFDPALCDVEKHSKERKFIRPRKRGRRESS